MGLFDLFRGQFIDIVEWVDETPGVLVHKFERHNNEIKNNAKLVVRPGQKAVFVNEGQIADHFGPGTYTLTTANMPILTSLLSLPTAFVSWHKAEVYFIKTTEQLNRKWGTPQPVMMRDQDFGILRLRAFGNYAYKIGEDNDMLARFVGAQSDFLAANFEAQMGPKVVSMLSDALAELKIPALDLAAQYNEISELMLQHLNTALASMGVVLTAFTVENINLPEEVNKAIDRRSALGTLNGLNNGVLNQYSQLQAADAMMAAAQNTGNGGAVMGMMMGGQMAGMVNQNLYQQASVPPPPPPPPAAPTYFLAVNGQRQGPYDMSALQSMAMAGTLTPQTQVWTAGMPNWQPAGSVPALTAIFGAVPPPIN